MRGPGVRAGVEIKGASVFDITPTILAVEAMPLAKDMRGKVLVDAFEEGALHEPRYVASYTEMPTAPAIPDDLLRSDMDQDIMKRLRSIGYIDDEHQPVEKDTN
jgi:hypothetical protein